MKNFSNFVKHFRKSFCSTPFKLHNTLLSPRPAKTAALQGGAHYIDIKLPVNTLNPINSTNPTNTHMASQRTCPKYRQLGLYK